MIDEIDKSTGSEINKYLRAVLNMGGGAIPLVGGALAGLAGVWSENEQKKVNDFLKYREQMLENELKQQLQTILEMMQRMEQIQKDVSERVKSDEYQSLVQKCFRDWSDINSEEKREYIKNLLVNSAATSMCKDDVIRLFIDWIKTYSDLHFKVIGCIYKNSAGINRASIWNKVGSGAVREDSAEADLYRLLIRDLSTGGIIRQHRPVDYNGNSIKSPVNKRQPSIGSSKVLKSAFDEEELYVLTELGKQFVHYAMTEVSEKISYE